MTARNREPVRQESLRVLATWRALGRPRRLFPFLLVAVALWTAEWVGGSGLPGGLLALGTCLVFFFFAPAWWRLCFSASTDGAFARSLAAYVALSVTVVVAATSALHWALGLSTSLLTDAAGYPVTVVLFVVGGWGLGRDIELSTSLSHERHERQALSEELEVARVMAVRRQLDPHFLFNTLNAIAEWCSRDPEVAERATLQLAAMLRDMLQGLQQSRWTLTQELDLVEQLFELHRLRDPEQLTYSIESDITTETMVPPLLLLPLAENAMTHGVRSGHAGQVRLQVSDADGITLRLTNPGPLRQRSRPGGHGLNAFQKRLQAAFGPSASFSITGEEDSTGAPETRVTVKWRYNDGDARRDCR